MPIVHIIGATLKDDASEEAVTHALDLGRALPSAEGVQHSILGRSPQHLVAATWLEGRAALEPFAAADAGIDTVRDAAPAEVSASALPPEALLSETIRPDRPAFASE